MENTWQVCPKCDGNKAIFEDNNSTTYPHKVVQCYVCNGYGVLNKETGLPPGINKNLFIVYPPITEPLPSDEELYVHDTIIGLGTGKAKPNTD